MTRRSPRPLLLAVVALAALAAGCSSSDGDGPVTIYSGRSEELVGPVLEQFTEATGIEVEVQYAGSADLALLITEEGDDTPADVYLSQSPGAMGFLESAGLLADLDSAILDAVPASARDDDGQWVGVTGRQRVLVYNPDMVSVDELPSSVQELTDPAWSGRIGVAPGNGSFQDFVTAMRADLGDDATSAWLEGLAANDPLTYSGNSAIVAAVGRGEVAAGLVNHYYNFRAVAEDPNHPALNHQLDVDDPGSVLIVTGAAVIEGADQADGAAQLIQYLLEADAQRYFADETFEYPLAAGVEPADVIPATSFADTGSIDYEGLTGGLEATRDLITAAGFEG